MAAILGSMLIIPKNFMIFNMMHTTYCVSWIRCCEATCWARSARLTSERPLSDLWSDRVSLWMLSVTWSLHLPIQAEWSSCVTECDVSDDL